MLVTTFQPTSLTRRAAAPPPAAQQGAPTPTDQAATIATPADQAAPALPPATPPAAPSTPAASPAASDERAARFYGGASATSKWIARASGALEGGAIGILLGAALGSAMFGPSSVGVPLLALAGGGGLGFAGYKVFDAGSRYCGNLGRDLDKNCPDRGEAVGRTAFNVGLQLLGGNWKGALGDVAVAGVGGAINAARG